MIDRAFGLLMLFVATIQTVLATSLQPIFAAEIAVSALAKNTHFHGIAVGLKDSLRLYLATHHGLYVVTPDGNAMRVSDTGDDFMGFTPHPVDPSVLYASGHPANGGSLGFITSLDGGKSWKKIADGVGGPVDFHKMDVSRADPNVVFGVFRGLQMSKDGGRSWKMIGPAPEGTIDIAASARDANTIFAATQLGIVRSVDGGRSWTPAHLLRRTATMIYAASDGRLYAFQIGAGLIRTTDPGLAWQLVSNDFGDEYILHFAVDPSNKMNMYGITLNSKTRRQSITVSGDGGATWKALGTD